MKKAFLTALFALTSIALFTQTIPQGLQYRVEGRSVTITRYTGGSATTLVIPAQIQGMPVTSIGARAFAGISVWTGNRIAYRFDSLSTINRLTSVTIPSSVISIGNEAFAGTILTSVIIPNSVTSIGESAFADTRLTNVTIPSGVASIGRLAFFGDLLTAIHVDPANPHYRSENGVLYTKDGRILVQYPSGREGASFAIPDSVTTIGEGAFAGSSLTSVTIPDSVTTIGADAFAESSLTSVTIPDSVATIGAGAFAGDIGEPGPLTDVTIGNGVTSIGNEAFAGTGLTSLTIPSSVTSIGGGAFFRATDLTRVTFEGSSAIIADDIPGPYHSILSVFPGNLREVYLGTGGGAGTYTRTPDGWEWRKLR